MYISYPIIVALTFGINIYLSTRTTKADGGESDVAPVVQMVQLSLKFIARKSKDWFNETPIRASQ
ncbi:MAG: hypothetical protein U5N85_15415 [Arcicella sp.]|nr:hypothetical protein [Arcicella sp.]